MDRDNKRRELIEKELTRAGLDALVCTLPTNVLVLSGYWPVVGVSVAIATRTGRVAVLAPEDEAELAGEGRADEVRTFQPATLNQINTASAAVAGPLLSLLGDLEVRSGRLGLESGDQFQPDSYIAMHLYGDSLRPALDSAAELAPAQEVLARLRSIKTPRELQQIQRACQIAASAFEHGAGRILAGMTESDVAEAFRPDFFNPSSVDPPPRRCGAHVACMSGPNAATAFGAYALSGRRKIAEGDVALVHCNSTADGYWTDITRTFVVGVPDDRLQRMRRAISAARSAALAMLRPGVRAAEVDAAARRTLDEWGFGANFKHSTGHGVGFAAIDHVALPRLHPRSADVLEPGMVFNIEPGIYIDGCCGMRHCDMMALTDDGPQMLTPFLPTG